MLLERLAKTPVARAELETDHRRGARRPSLPLHRLHQIPRGGARRDPRRCQALSRGQPSERTQRNMKSEMRFQLRVAVAALATSMLAGYAASQTRTATRWRRRRALRRSPTPTTRSAAMFTELGKVLTHPRCVNCHPAGDRPRQGDEGRLHQPPVARGADGHGLRAMRCSICHQQRQLRSRPHAGPSGMASRAARDGVGGQDASPRSARRSRIPRATAAARSKT